MDDRTDDETDEWKGGRPSPQLDKTKDIIYKDKDEKSRKHPLMTPINNM
jgi:hypothetical protein